MNYAEARDYLEKIAEKGSVLGLASMKELLRRLDNPQDKLKFIHISGTNGKGSVLAYLSTILKEAGYMVGRYISPTLFSYRERIQVNEEYIGQQELADLVSQVKPAVESMEIDGKNCPTIFEIETALAFLYFLKKKCDIVVLETGMGGDTDATNVIQTAVMEVLVSISMDHMQFLGDTLAEIAGHKAGIIKPDTVVVSVLQKPEAMEVIEKKAKEQNASLKIADFRYAENIFYGIREQRFSYGDYEDIVIHLAGSYQIKNAVTALEGVKALREIGFQISEEQMRRGFEKTVWNGRFTVVCDKPLFIMDGAHNRDGAMELKRSIETYLKGCRIFAVCGVFRDKEYEEILQMTAPYIKKMITIETPDNPRALPAQELAQAARKYIADVHPAKNINQAVDESFAAAKEENDVILAFGSLSFLGEIRKALKSREEQR
ncbi:MAG: folylpolyglutamate synthase/dihydrofolate synthase family protein [Eubacteriales bacterium]|nr:folylpolyglutamate synthase/dihydrofolate synthase family protein [Eubacteriales bacterium]